MIKAYQTWQSASPKTRLLACWGVFLLLFNLYCLLWRHVIGGARFDFIDSQTFWLKEWGVLLVFSLLLISTALGQRVLRSPILLLAVVICAVGLSTAARIFVDFQFYALTLASSVTVLLPKYIIACALGITVVHVCMRQSRSQSDVSPRHPLSLGDSKEANLHKPADALEEQGSLHIEHRGMVKKLPYEVIQYIKAAGNYVEIYDQQAVYLYRATIKEMSSKLPAMFMQVHRSHIVNLCSVSKLTRADNGKAVAQLANGHSVGVSKTFRSQLQQSLGRVDL
ncbi:LytTR family DNA-binding domain-containing protein [Pseudoalteromonas sp. YIC-656]|uniref:LytTR family DNA-binding domain-containing protein n=1 Tax=Pseudoalteromonas pernae TaxID=3118054 RepID=UPI003242FA77